MSAQAWRQRSQPTIGSVSLVVCTKDRAGSLEHCLQAIAAIEPPHRVTFEFLLVDNGSADQTYAVFQDWSRRMRFPAHYVFEPAPGIGHAMDTGYRNSSGAIVAFTDDDCYPARDFPAAVAAAFSDPAVGVVGGRILLHDPTDLPVTIEESPQPRRYQAGRYVRPGQFQGANLCFRRAALDAIGGFDPLFGPGSYIGSAADCDAAARVCLAGWDGLYDPRIIVWHHHGRKPGHLPALRKQYALGSGGYHMKLLLREQQVSHFLRYTAGAAKRALRHPSVVGWELVGAKRYLLRPRDPLQDEDPGRWRTDPTQTAGRVGEPRTQQGVAKAATDFHGDGYSDGRTGKRRYG